MNYFQLFISFLQVGLFSIGGGYAAMPLIQNQVVEKHGWITMGEFTDLITIAEMTPGPMAVNSATFVGIRIGGLLGAMVATFAVILPSCLILSALYYFYKKYRQFTVMQTVLASLRTAVVALISSAALMILSTVLFSHQEIHLSTVNWVSAGLFLIAFILLRMYKPSPILVMLCCGIFSLAIHLLLDLPVGS